MAVPKIRLKGFDADWEKSNFGNFGSVAMCKRIFKDQTSPIGDIPFFKIGTFGLKPDAYITRELYNEYKSKYSFPSKGDILISAAGTIGRTIVYSGDDAYFQDSNIVWLNHNDQLNNAFLKYLYSIVNWASLEGATIKRLYNSNILQTEIVIPEYTEQEAISNYFQSLDSLIETTDKKIATLKQTKQASLQSMFPQEGETKPRVRFKGFTDEWKKTTFGDLLSFERPDNYIVTNDKYSDDYITPVLTANKGFILGYTNETRTYNNKCIIFDDFTLDNKYVDFPFMVKSSALKILSLKKTEVDNLYFVYALLNRTNIEVLGHARHYISVVQPTEVLVPADCNEQKLIAEYFSNLDKQISIQEQRLEKLKQIKSACLKNMFV